MGVSTGGLEGGQSGAGAIGQAGQAGQVTKVAFTGHCQVPSSSSSSCLVTWSKQPSGGKIFRWLGIIATAAATLIATASAMLPVSGNGWSQGKVARQRAWGGVQVGRWKKEVGSW